MIFMKSESDSIWKAPISLRVLSSGYVPGGVFMCDRSTLSPAFGGKFPPKL
jgi:hypothetical protein